MKHPEKETENTKVDGRSEECKTSKREVKKEAAMRDFDARKFDFITKLSNPVQLEY